MAESSPIPLLNEIFGPAGPNPTVSRRLADAVDGLHALGIVALWVYDDAGTLLAASKSEPPPCRLESVCESTNGAATADLPMKTTGGCRLDTISLSSRFGGGVLAFACRTGQPAANEGIPRQLLSAVGTMALDLCLQDRSVVELDARLRVLTREQDVLEAEHRRVVAMNLEEREARLSEQRSFVKRLEREVAEKTRQIHEKTVNLEVQAGELRDAIRKAEASNEAKNAFLANISHEIRTPLTAILGFAEILLQESDRRPLAQRQKDLRTIQRNGQYLLELINDILDLSKIESGRFDVHREVCNPLQIVADVMRLMKVRAESKDLRLELDLAGPVPEIIQSDSIRLRQILINLLGNAVKFTESGRVVLRVRTNVADDPNDAELHFEVIDTGPGIPEDQLGELFQPFTQLDASLTRKHGGTGLGLTITKRLVELLGGSISVHSAVGKGSTFTVALSIGRFETPSIQICPVHFDTGVDLRPRQIAAAPERLDCRILLVEDGADNQRLISFHLEKAGAMVTLADNGRAGVESAFAAENDNRPFDVVLMDMQMPVQDGYQATQYLREHGFDRPIIALTAHAMSGDMEKCLAHGCDDYLAKPIDRDHLIATVARHARKVRCRSSSC